MVQKLMILKKDYPKVFPLTGSLPSPLGDQYNQSQQNLHCNQQIEATLNQLNRVTNINRIITFPKIHILDSKFRLIPTYLKF